MSKSPYWTDHELQRLRILARTGEYTQEQMADILKRSRTSITRKLQLLGVTAKRPPRANPMPQQWAGRYEAPDTVQVDHLAHCLRVIRANAGREFPVCVVHKQSETSGQPVDGRSNAQRSIGY